MTDRNPDDHPDSRPSDDQHGSVESEGDRSERGSVEQSPDAGNGAVGGTDGVTKNQDDTAQ